MKRPTVSSNSSEDQALGSRRQFLRRAGASAALATGPWILPARARASSGELNILLWEDACPPGLIQAFEEKTEVKVNFTPASSSWEIIDVMKGSKGKGFDLCGAPHSLNMIWEVLGLIQPIDYGQLSNASTINPAMVELGDEEWSFADRGSHWVPYIWGTEGLMWRHDLWTPEQKIEDFPLPSYADLWETKLPGKTFLRPLTAMLGAGLILEAQGRFEKGELRRAYDNERTMRQVWQAIVDYCIPRKPRIHKPWESVEEQRQIMLEDEVVLGQVLQGPAFMKIREQAPWTFRAPKEGALAWIYGICLSNSAENLEQAYAFIDFCLDPEISGRSIDGGEVAGWGGHGYNSVVLGADQFASPEYAKQFYEIYPKNTLANIWPMPRVSLWFNVVRYEYLTKFLEA